MKTKMSIIDNPNRALTDKETIEQLLPVLPDGNSPLAVNQVENLVLLKNKKGVLNAFSYCVSHFAQVGKDCWESKLGHEPLGFTHHTKDNFVALFGTNQAGAFKQVGTLQRFKSDTDLLYVTVFRVGIRRKMVDEIGNIFVKAFGSYWKFPEQVSY